MESLWSGEKTALSLQQSLPTPTSKWERKNQGETRTTMAFIKIEKPLPRIRLPAMK